MKRKWLACVTRSFFLAAGEGRAGESRPLTKPLPQEPRETRGLLRQWGQRRCEVGGGRGRGSAGEDSRGR